LLPGFEFLNFAPRFQFFLSWSCPRVANSLIPNNRCVHKALTWAPPRWCLIILGPLFRPAPFFPLYYETRPSALGMSDPVMESLEILGAPEFSNLWRVEGDEGEIDEKVVKKDEKLWKIMKKWWKTVKTMKKYARQ